MKKMTIAYALGTALVLSGLATSAAEAKPRAAGGLVALLRWRYSRARAPPLAQPSGVASSAAGGCMVESSPDIITW